MDIHFCWRGVDMVSYAIDSPSAALDSPRPLGFVLRVERGQRGVGQKCETRGQRRWDDGWLNRRLVSALDFFAPSSPEASLTGHPLALSGFSGLEAGAWS